MKTYYLKSKESNEIINRKEADSLEIAIEYFSKVKKLSEEDLIKIYIVVDK